MGYRWVIALIFSVCVRLGWAQTQPIDKFRFAEIKFHTGGNFYSGEQLQEAFQNGYGAVELRYGWNTHGKHDWEASYNYPSYGIGWYSGYIGDVETFGSPNALYGFMSFALNNLNKRNVFKIEPALGLTYNLIPYDPETNTTNDAFGARLAVYFNLSFGGSYKLANDLDVTYGFDFTHFSNGRTVVPNYGLNMAGINLGTRLYFNRTNKQNARPPALVHRSPRPLHSGRLLLYQAIGTVQNYIDQGTDKRYITTSSVIDWQYRFTEMHGISVGADLFSDQGLKDTLANPLYKTYQTATFPGVHIGYDFMWWKFTALVQFGYLLTEAGREMKTPFFVRPAIRYDITKRFHAQVGLKTYKKATADWVEFGLGMNLFGD